MPLIKKMILALSSLLILAGCASNKVCEPKIVDHYIFPAPPEVLMEKPKDLKEIK